MDPEPLVRWALDDARTIEERYCVELLVEECLGRWHVLHQTGYWEPWEEQRERQRQRKLNPAYEPGYTEESLRRAAEVFPEKTTWFAPHSSVQRPLRDLRALRFLPNLVDLRLGGSESTDLSPLIDMPGLRRLEFSSVACEDFRPLGRCTQLRALFLNLGVHWPEVAGLEKLADLEEFHLHGNLLVFERGLQWPRVRRGRLECSPLHARNVRDLPQFPACEFLTLDGVERLDGIEAMPRLRNLTLQARVRDFEPLTALKELTWITCTAAEPLDVAPLARLPKLAYAAFTHQYNFSSDRFVPRDFSPLVEAPSLHELQVTGCPPVATEVAALNAGLAPWSEAFLLPEPRPLEPLRVIVAPYETHPRGPEIHRSPGEPEWIDDGVRDCEFRWAQRLVSQEITRRLGTSDWGELSLGSGKGRSIGVTLQSFALVERTPEVIEAARGALARIRPEYTLCFMIALKAPTVEPTEAQLELQEQFRDEQETADYERRLQEHKDYLDRLHRFRLKQQEGGAIKPEEFAAPAPWEEDEDDDDEDSDDLDSGDVAVKQKPDPPPSFFDEEHPLADNYSLMGIITLSEAWFSDHDAQLVTYLMGRAPDQIIPREPKG